MPGAVSPLLAAKAEKAWKRRKAAKKAVKKASKMTSTEAARHKNSQVAAASSSSQATATGNSSNTKSFGSAKVQGTTTFTAPTLSETIKNLSNAAKNGSTTQNTPAQNISIPLFDNHQPVKNEGGNLSSASSTKSNSVLSRGILGAAQGNEAATIKNNTTGRTFVNSRGETVKVDAPQKPSLSERMSNATQGKILTPAASYANDIQNEKEYKEGLEDATKLTPEEMNPMIGAGADHQPSEETQNNINSIVNNWDLVPAEKKIATIKYIAGNAKLSDSNRDVIMNTYNSTTGQDKIDILDMLIYKNGITPEIQKMMGALSPDEKIMQIDTSFSALYGENTPVNRLKGMGTLAYYDKAVIQSKADEFEKNWAAKNYTSVDSLADTIMDSTGGFMANGANMVNSIRAYLIQTRKNYFNVTSPTEGTGNYKNWAEALKLENQANDSAKVVSNVVKSVLNIAGDVVRPFLNAKYTDENAKEHGYDTADEWANAVSDKLLSAMDSYYRDVQITQIKSDAANLPESVRVVNNIISAVGQTLPSVVIGLANPAVGLATLGVSSGGQYARQAYDAGASLEDSVTYGVMGGLGEALTERMFTGFGWFGKGIGNAVAEKTGKSILKPATIEVLDGFKKSGFGQALTYFVHSGAEASEEMVGQVLQSYLQRATYDPDAKNATLKDIAAAGGYGAVVSGILGLPQTALGVTSAVADSASAKEYTNQMKEMAATQISNIQKLVESKQITLAQAQSAMEHINDSVKKSIAKVSGSLAGASAAGKTVKEALSAKTQQAVAKFQQSAFGKALSYFAAHGVEVSPAEAGLVVQAYLKDSSGENGSDLGITSTFGDQGSNGQSVDSAAAGVGSPSKEGLTEDSPHVVSSQEEAIAELRKVAATKKPGEWISVVKVDGKGATQYTALVSSTHDIQQVQYGMADPKVYKNSRGKQAENQAANELKRAGNGGIISTTSEAVGNHGIGNDRIVDEVGNSEGVSKLDDW